MTTEIDAIFCCIVFDVILNFYQLKCDLFVLYVWHSPSNSTCHVITSIDADKYY